MGDLVDRRFEELKRAVRAGPRSWPERARQHLDVRNDRLRLAQARRGEALVWSLDQEEEPLVTIRIATRNRGAVVVDRAIASALRQSYERTEVLIVGDHCDAASCDAIRRVRDQRVRFINLPAQGLYPGRPKDRWHVAGSVPMNVGLSLASGSWITSCDDDDELTLDHVEVLLNAAKAQRVEFIFSDTEVHYSETSNALIGDRLLQFRGITHGAILYHSALRFIRYNEYSWRLDEPFDWNMWWRMRQIGVVIGYLPQVTYRYYPAGYEGKPGSA